MLQAAKNLEFEKFTELRDQLKKLRESVLFSPL
jgi:excinuclease UvrABC helicase subunit UvrB